LTGWLQQTLEARWSVPRWPREWYGRGLPDEQAKIIEREFAALGAPGSGLDLTHLAANTLLAFGQDALKRELLPKLLTDRARICLLYSRILSWFVYASYVLSFRAAIDTRHMVNVLFVSMALTRSEAFA
jgi:hypothetical protein